MSRQNHNLGPQVQNMYVKNKVVVQVANTTKVGNGATGAVRKPSTNNNKPMEGNPRSNYQKPSGCVQNTNPNQNRNYNNHGMQQNVPKNAFPQQQFNAKPQKQNGYATKPHQPSNTYIKTANQTNIKTANQTNIRTANQANIKTANQTHIKTANQTNLQFGSNPKPIHHGHQKKNNNNQGTNQVPFKTHKQSNNSQVVVNVKQIVVHKHVVINK